MQASTASEFFKLAKQTVTVFGAVIRILVVLTTLAVF